MVIRTACKNVRAFRAKNSCRVSFWAAKRARAMTASPSQGAYAAMCLQSPGGGPEYRHREVGTVFAAPRSICIYAGLTASAYLATYLAR